MTAHRCVFGLGTGSTTIQGQTVLVNGGGGAVGNHAHPAIAKWGGARVLATVSNDWHAEDAARAGADLILNRYSDDIKARLRQVTGGQGIDRFVEVDFGGNLDVIVDQMAVNSTIAVYASRSQSEPKVPIREFMRRNVTILTVVLNSAPLAARQNAQADLRRWLEAGPKLHRYVGPYGLDQIAEAHRTAEVGGKRGTVLIAV